MGKNKYLYNIIILIEKCKLIFNLKKKNNFSQK